MALANTTSKIRADLIAKTFNKELSSSKKVLDIGCGTGVVLNRLNEIFGFEDSSGCDIENYTLANINYRQQKQIDKIPFKKNVFDVSMYNDVLHHTNYNNQLILIKEALRVSKKVLVFELIPNIINKTGDYLLNKIHNPNMDIPFTYREVNGWKKLFTKAGAKTKIIKVRRPLFYPFKHVGFVLTRHT